MAVGVDLEQVVAGRAGHLDHVDHLTEPGAVLEHHGHAHQLVGAVGVAVGHVDRRGLQLRAAQRLRGGAVGDPLERDQQPALVGTAAGDGAGRPADDDLDPRGEAPRDVGERLDHDLAPQAVRLQRPGRR